MVRFGPWKPDQYALGRNVAGDAKGVIPSPEGYLPWPQSVAASATIGAAAVGAFAARTTTGTLNIFTGTQTTLQKYASATAWTDVTRLAGGAYNVPDDEMWRFTQFGNRLIAVNANDAVQYIDIDAGTNFAALSGSPPNARVARTVGDFVMLGGLTSYPNRVMWSGRNNSDFWTPGTQDCDIQDFPDGGIVNGIAPFGFGRGLIFQEGAIRAFQAVNDRSIFNFQRIEDDRGLLAPDSLAVRGSAAYYLSEDGFFVTDGSGASKAIGDDVVDRWFQADVNYSRIYAVRGAIDPVHSRVFWIYPSTGNTSAILDRCLCYEISTNTWSYADVSGTLMFGGATAGYSIDNIDTLLASLGYTLETVPFSFDARFLRGGAPYLAIFDSAFKMAFFSGTPMAATLETADFQPIPGQRAFIRGCRPIADTTAATIAMGSKEAVQGSVVFGAAASQNATGMAPLRSSGRWFRARMSIPAGTTWTHAEGVSFDEDSPRTTLIAGAGNR